MTVIVCDTKNTRPVASKSRLEPSAASCCLSSHECLRSVHGTGARESCGQGLCGCRTVLINDHPVSGCLYLAPLVDGAKVTTIEGLETQNELSPVQQAFIEASAFQCGYCMPGFVMMVTKLLDEDPDDEKITHYLSGNLCRCAAYPEVLEAVKLAARKRRTVSGEGLG